MTLPILLLVAFYIGGGVSNVLHEYWLMCAAKDTDEYQECKRVIEETPRFIQIYAWIMVFIPMFLLWFLPYNDEGSD